MFASDVPKLLVDVSTKVRVLALSTLGAFGPLSVPFADDMARFPCGRILCDLRCYLSLIVFSVPRLSGLLGNGQHRRTSVRTYTRQHACCLCSTSDRRVHLFDPDTDADFYDPCLEENQR